MPGTLARQRVAGVQPRDHVYTPDPDLKPGTLTGVIVRPNRSDYVLVGPAAINLGLGEVVAWQVSRPGGGWIDGPSWPTVEQAVAVARDPQRVAVLAEWSRVRDEAWAAHRRAAELDRQAAALLATIEAADR